jgi:hypothetical protein
MVVNVVATSGGGQSGMFSSRRGSMPMTRLDGATATTAAVSAPVPDPTSRTASPSRTPANSTRSGANARLHLPMKRSYASLARNLLPLAPVLSSHEIAVLFVALEE